MVRFSTSDEGIRVLEDILQYSSAKVGMFHPGYKPVALTLLWAFERLFFILLQLLVTAHLDVQRFQFQVCMTPIIYTLHRDPSGYHWPLSGMCSMAFPAPSNPFCFCHLGAISWQCMLMPPLCACNYGNRWTIAWYLGPLVGEMWISVNIW